MLERDRHTSRSLAAHEVCLSARSSLLLLAKSAARHSILGVMDFYSVLGVSPQTDPVVVRAAYKALMLRYHPDTNKSSNAAARALEINEAYAVLGNPQKRAAYDASRATRYSSPPPPSPPAPPASSPSPQPATPNEHKKGGCSWWGWAPLTFMSLIAIGRWATQTSEPYDNSNYEVSEALAENSLAAMGMDTMPAAETPADTAIMDNVLLPSASAGLLPNGSFLDRDTSDVGDSDRNYRPPFPTTLDFGNLETATNIFARVLNSRGVQGARSYSQNCHKAVKADPQWDTADGCAAFDYAAHYVDRAVSRASDAPLNAYFTFQVENQADHYKDLSSQSWTISQRLQRIQSVVEPLTSSAVLNQGSTGSASSKVRPRPSSQDLADSLGNILD